MGKILEVKNLNIVYKTSQKAVVRSCSFDLSESETLGIVGESGSGKTTLVMSVLGFLKEGAVVTGGEIRFLGEDITPPLTEKRRRRLRGGEIAVVMQNAMSCLDPVMKIGKQIIESLCLNGEYTKSEAREKAIELLDITGIRDAGKCMGKYPFECSGGMQQRICIAIALAGNPKMLIADEPTTALDVTVQAQILNLLKRISRDWKIPVLFISHDLGIVAALCTRLLIMHEGKIIEEGDTKEIFYGGEKTYTRTLLQAKKNIECLGRQVGGYKKNDIDPLLCAEKLTKCFCKKAVLQDVSICILPGQVYGLAGESGCGKSTLARTIQGIYRPDKGCVTWNGDRIDDLKGKQKRASRQRMQMIFQDPYQALNPAMTIEENFREALYVRGITTQGDVAEAVCNMAESVGLDLSRIKALPECFSGGQLQRATIARALLMQPQLLICDEPFTALDMTIQMQLLSLLEHMKKKNGFSMLFIGHDLSMIERISDIIGVMYAGIIVEEGPAGKVAEEPWHPYTKMLFLAASKVKITAKNNEKQVILEEKTETEYWKGCPFWKNCKYAVKKCADSIPETYEYGGRKIRCFLYAPDKDRDSRYGMISQI